MYSHNGTWDFLKLVAMLGFIALAVWWLQGAVGQHNTVLIVFALVGVFLFAGGSLFAHMNQKQTLDAITKFNANDAQIDKYRQQSFKALAQGESAMNRAAAQLTVLDAKRVTQIADQRAKLLTDTERAKWEVQQQPQQADAWTWDDDAGADFQQWG
ncbi:MAG: hypothetical protein AB7L09_24755 [Nitrospira sp.]